MNFNALLILENGTRFKAEFIGTPRTSFGEIVFNTSMTGYQEILTDPSYQSQIITMTFPTIGNYGTSVNNNESPNVCASGFVVKEICEYPSHFESNLSLKDFLEKHKVAAISGIDTRKLTKIIRSHGTMKSLIAPNNITELEIEKFFKKDLSTTQVQKVSSKENIHHYSYNSTKKVGLIDFGYKKSILKELLKRNVDVEIFPHDISIEEIEISNIDGIVLSNGPGNPESLIQVPTLIKKLQQSLPIMGICLGHQLLALANGAKTEKLHFGHRGSNHPVQDLITKKVYITSQNHGYAVVKESIDSNKILITQINVNDKSIEAISIKNTKAFSLQYHPEANAGPNDTTFYFDHFIKSL